MTLWIGSAAASRANLIFNPTRTGRPCPISREEGRALSAVRSATWVIHRTGAGKIKKYRLESDEKPASPFLGNTTYLKQDQTYAQVLSYAFFTNFSAKHLFLTKFRLSKASNFKISRSDSKLKYNYLFGFRN